MPANAKLQNVVVNGGYQFVESECFVNVTQLTTDEDGVSPSLEPQASCLVLSPFMEGARGYRGGFQNVHVAPRPRPNSYPDLGRVGFAFYFGVPGWMDGAQHDGDLIVYVNGHQVFRTFLSGPEWQPRIVDLEPWANETVDITFRGAWTEGAPLPVFIALPRIVAWHGPRSDGGGGLRFNGPHGGRAVPVSDSIAEHRRLKLGIDGTLIEGGPLMVQQFDVYRPATLVLESSAYTYTASLCEGQYWMPLPLPAVDNPDRSVYALSGMVESGAVDIIPNFMEKDTEYLRAIEARLKADAIQPE